MTPNQAYLYARDMIKGRWPEGDGAIGEHAGLWADYLDRFGPI